MGKKHDSDDDVMVFNSIEDVEDGQDQRRRVYVSRVFWAVFEEAGAANGMKATLVFELLCSELLKSWREQNKTMRNPTMLLEAMEALKFQLTSKALQSIDLTPLARNNRVRGTGFDGVYRCREGYVIDARDPATGRMKRQPGFYPEPELAAWARYEHYRRHKLPYGKFEEEIEKTRGALLTRVEGLSEHSIRAIAISTLSAKGEPPDPAFLHWYEDRWLTQTADKHDGEDHIREIAIRREKRAATRQQHGLSGPPQEPLPELSAYSGAPTPETQMNQLMAPTAPPKAGPPTEVTLANQQWLLAEAEKERERILQEAKAARAARLRNLPPVGPKPSRAPILDDYDEYYDRPLDED